jgi:hypothetical protein
MRRNRPAGVHAASMLQTAWVDTAPNCPRTPAVIASAVEWGWASSHAGIARRGMVTRSPAERNARSAAPSGSTGAKAIRSMLQSFLE